MLVDLGLYVDDADGINLANSLLGGGGGGWGGGGGGGHGWVILVGPKPTSLRDFHYICMYI